jgi:predicted dehydrogenase
MIGSPPAALRWGILGCARISRRGLIPGIQRSESGALSAIASRDASTARAWADEFGIPKPYGAYEALLADPEIDAVYIPLPNELHRPWVEAAADAGKHVLCEKPLALTAAEARGMAVYCQAKGVVLREAAMWRHQPRSLEIRRRVAAGAIGALRLIQVEFSFPIDLGDWRLDPARGGGAMFDIGTYGLNAARFFAGDEPTSIRGVARYGPSGVDMTLAAALKFPSGVVAQFDCSFEAPFRCLYRLVGSTGWIETPDAFLPPEAPTAIFHGGDGVETWTFDGKNQYACMVDAFTAAVAASGAGGEPGEDGVAQMTALEAVLTACRD